MQVRALCAECRFSPFFVPRSETLRRPARLPAAERFRANRSPLFLIGRIPWIFRGHPVGDRSRDPSISLIWDPNMDKPTL